jgi:hypothetical protein
VVVVVLKAHKGDKVLLVLLVVKALLVPLVLLVQLLLKVQ